MNESNCSCNCCCQYSTPPWWVTMGFTPPHATQSPYVVTTPGVQTTTPHTTTPGTLIPAPGTVVHPATGIGGLLGQVGTTVGNTVGTIVGTPLNVAGNVLTDVVNGIGGVLGSIF